MRRHLFHATLVLLAASLGASATWLWTQRPLTPSGPMVLERVREVARLEALEVLVFKKVSFEPDPAPTASFWGEVVQWARYSLRKPGGRAIVFAKLRLGLDLDKLDASRVRIRGARIELSLPPLEAQVELIPGETEIIGSNLDSEQTAQLFERAKDAFTREALADPELARRARASAERSIRAVLTLLGFREVVFVEVPPGRGA
jgi:hypothetical protein